MQRRTGALLALIVLGIALSVGFFYSQGSADFWGQDRQPVAFSHRLHAGRLRIDCLFCHRGAQISPVASIPPLSLCLSCHRSLKAQTPETEKVLAYWNSRQPIPWVRLQRLPDFVRFTHQIHLYAGFQCTDCHGEVAQMSGTPRAPTYEMGWCISCHKRNRASEDCFTCHY